MKDEIEKMINDYGKKVCSKMAGLIRDELTETAQNAIAAFYNDYDPKYYSRHYTNFQKRSFRKYYSNPHNKIFTGGVELTPGLLEEYYQEDADVVFDSVYAGFHGPMGYDVNPSKKQILPHRMQPSPMDMILDKREEILDNVDYYRDKAISMILKEV